MDTITKTQIYLPHTRIPSRKGQSRISPCVSMPTPGRRADRGCSGKLSGFRGGGGFQGAEDLLLIVPFRSDLWRQSRKRDEIQDGNETRAAGTGKSGQEISSRAIWEAASRHKRQDVACPGACIAYVGVVPACLTVLFYLFLFGFLVPSFFFPEPRRA